MGRAYVSAFEHDIFISYSSVDDIVEDADAGRKGQVSAFVELLNKRLARLLGKADGFSIWMDRTRLGGQFQLSQGLAQPLKQSAILLAFVSPGYQKSEWCSWEREEFSRAGHPSSDGRTRVFLVELDSMDDSPLPKEFADLKVYRLWVKEQMDKHPRVLNRYNPAMESDYKNVVDDLARDLVKALQHLTIGTPGPETPPQATVYLAEPTEDLLRERGKVTRFLEQQNIAVIPRQVLPRDDAGAFAQAVKSSLADADLFVQLLSPVSGRKLSDEQTYVSHQFESARAGALPVLQWRDPRVKQADLEGVEDAAHRGLLEGVKVQAVQLEEFMQEIVKTLKRLRDEEQRRREIQQKETTKRAGKSKTNYIFVLADTKDSTIAEKVFTFLDRQGFPCGLPITLEMQGKQAKPSEIRKDLEVNIELADGALIVYGQTPPSWYRNKLIEVRKLQTQCRKAGACEVGLVVTPPKPVLLKWPRLHHIPSDADNIDEQAFQPFLDAIVNATTCANAE
jgi:hypothetical protein